MFSRSIAINCASSLAPGDMLAGRLLLNLIQPLGTAPPSGFVAVTGREDLLRRCNGLMRLTRREDGFGAPDHVGGSVRRVHDPAGPSGVFSSHGVFSFL